MTYQQILTLIILILILAFAVWAYRESAAHHAGEEGYGAAGADNSTGKKRAKKSRRKR